MKLTAERLRELLHYDPETGVFKWRVGRRGTARAGTIAGRLHRDGYRRIQVDGVSYAAGPLAWLYMKSEWPAGQIDHENCARDDNWFTNLREANGSQNNMNTRLRRTNTSGFKGVTFHKACGRWQAGIRHAGRHRHLGLFDTATEAHAAYCKAALEIDPEFARFA